MIVEASIVPYRCRDIGYGIEEGWVHEVPIGGYDWTAKRPYLRSDGATVYLFDDELEDA